MTSIITPSQTDEYKSATYMLHVYILADSLINYIILVMIKVTNLLNLNLTLYIYCLKATVD